MIEQRGFGVLRPLVRRGDDDSVSTVGKRATGAGSTCSIIERAAEFSDVDKKPESVVYVVRIETLWRDHQNIVPKSVSQCEYVCVFFPAWSMVVRIGVTFGKGKAMSATVRINPQSHRKLKRLAAEMGESMPVVLEHAIEALRRQRFLDEAAEDFARLRKNKKAWAEELAERKLWEKTLSDGLGKD